MSQPRRASRVVVACIALGPVLLLSAVLIWATSSAGPGRPTENVALASGAPSASTPVLSLRRVPESLSDMWSSAALAASLQPVVDELNDESCLLVDVGSTPVRSVRAEQPVIPASNMKILTTGVLLDLLGADARYRTHVMGEMDADGSVAGDLYLVGGGDPMLSTAWYPESKAATPYAQEPATSLDDLADAVVDAGVRSVSGDVVGDESRYDDEYFRPSWDADLRVTNAGPYSALLVDDGRLVGGGVAEVPARAAAETFRQLLVDRGVSIEGTSTTGVAPTTAAEIASIDSAPLGEIVEHTLHTSDNNSAEMMLKEIAVASGRAGTSLEGLDALLDNLDARGIPVDGVAPTDGSGLDIQSTATCRVLVGTLVDAGPSSALVNAMPLLGTEGTLDGVLTDHPLAGRLFAKTGSLGQSAERIDVKALSGVLAPEGARPVTFSLLLNGGTVREEATYLPLWRDVADALAAYPQAPSAEILAPREPVAAP